MKLLYQSETLAYGSMENGLEAARNYCILKLTLLIFFLAVILFLVSYGLENYPLFTYPVKKVLTFWRFMSKWLEVFKVCLKL